MSYDPPGLDELPDDAHLLGFGSLMPPPEKKPSLIARIIKLPLKVLAWPFKLVAAVITFPARLFRRAGDTSFDD